MQIYLYLNAFLYLVFAVWCTVKVASTSSGVGYLAMSSGGHSEYLVIYGGLQLGLALMFTVLAKNPALNRPGIVIALCLYGPIVLYRVITVAKYWPVSTVTMATACLELALLVAGIVIHRATS
jgi:hypothetical protein